MKEEGRGTAALKTREMIFMMATTNVRSQAGRKKCAFCRHWYDPTNSHIRPKAPASGFWEYDNNAREMCLLTNLQRPSYTNCGKFEFKLE